MINYYSKSNGKTKFLFSFLQYSVKEWVIFFNNYIEHIHFHKKYGCNGVFHCTKQKWPFLVYDWSSCFRQKPNSGLSPTRECLISCVEAPLNAKMIKASAQKEHFWDKLWTILSSNFQENANIITKVNKLSELFKWLFKIIITADKFAGKNLAHLLLSGALL